MAAPPRTTVQFHPAEEVWADLARTLSRQFGEATFGSWFGRVTLRETPDEVCVVAATGVARDWIRQNAWRRIGELWAENDPLGRRLDLKSRMEIDAAAEATSAPATADVVLANAEPGAPEFAVEAKWAALTAGGSRLQGLQERWTFETFVGGPSNDFAFAVARRVASWADGHFNPVLFHGPYGFGKSHLLHATAWEAMRADPEARVIYMSAERFTAGFVKSLQDRTLAAFRDDLRAADLLLIDDVHFAAGKTQVQEELLQLLTARLDDGGRVVVTTDRSPSELSDMDHRLRSFFQAGLVCGIEPADRAMRLGILERKLVVLAGQGGFQASARPEVLQFLADRFTDSVRELEGALNTLVARIGGDIAKMTLDEAQSILRPHLSVSSRKVTVDMIQKAVAEHYALKQADLISERRARAVARPRQVALWMAKQLTTRSLPDIGRRFGGRDHTTVLHAVRRIEGLRNEDPAIARDIETISRKLGYTSDLSPSGATFTAGNAVLKAPETARTRRLSPAAVDVSRRPLAPRASGAIPATVGARPASLPPEAAPPEAAPVATSDEPVALVETSWAPILTAATASPPVSVAAEEPGFYFELLTRCLEEMSAAVTERFGDFPDSAQWDLVRPQIEAALAGHGADDVLLATTALLGPDAHAPGNLNLLLVAEAALARRREPLSLGIVHLLIAEQLQSSGRGGLGAHYALSAAEAGVAARRPELARRALAAAVRAEVS